MKAIFITYNQALTDPVMTVLNKWGVRGFTKWVDTQGRGSVNGDPHYGSHAWPEMNSSILAVTTEEKSESVLKALRELDSEMEAQGLRAFVWNIETQL